MSHLAIPKDRFIGLLKQKSKRELVDTLLELLHTSDEIYLDDGTSYESLGDSCGSQTSGKGSDSETVELLEPDAGPVSEDLQLAKIPSGDDAEEP